MTYLYHELDIYGSQLFVARTAKEWRQMAKNIDLEDRSTPECAGQTRRLLSTREGSAGIGHAIVFWIDARGAGSVGSLIGTCAHEATHGANFIFDWIGHDADAEKDEPTAYLIGWLTSWLWGAAAPQAKHLEIPC